MSFFTCTGISHYFFHHHCEIFFNLALDRCDSRSDSKEIFIQKLKNNKNSQLPPHFVSTSMNAIEFCYLLRTSSINSTSVIIAVCILFFIKLYVCENLL